MLKDFSGKETMEGLPSEVGSRRVWCAEVLDQIQYFTALEILWIEGFYEMVALPEWLGNLSPLQKLYIVDCNRLVHLPTEEAMRHLTQLKTLEIYDCPNLEYNERSKIDHIPFVDIQDNG